MVTGKRIPELDGLRGVAIALVLVWHGIGLSGPGEAQAPAVAWLVRFGESGVDLFFVLSGFLLGGILLDARNSPNYYRVFFIRRGCRIYPLYFAFLIVFPLGGVAESSERAVAGSIFGEPGPWLAYVLLVQNFWMAWANRLGPWSLSVTWSLGVEEQFYVILPFAIRWLQGRRLPWALALAFFAAPLSRLILLWFFPLHGIGEYVLPMCRAEPLCLGVLAAWGLRVPAIAEYLAKHRRIVVLPLLLSLALLAGSIFSRNPALQTLRYTGLALLYLTVLLAALLNSHSRFAHALKNPILGELGRLSFGIYLFHQLIRGALHAWVLGGPAEVVDGKTFAVMLLAYVGTVLLAKASWHWFEAPFIQAAHSLRY